MDDVRHNVLNHDITLEFRFIKGFEFNISYLYLIPCHLQIQPENLSIGSELRTEAKQSNIFRTHFYTLILSL